MSIYIILALVLAVSGVFMAGMSWLGHTAFMAKHRRREDKQHPVTEREHKISSVLNSMASIGVLFASVFFLHDKLLYPGVRTVSRLFWEPLAVLVLYDFGYYVLHRFVFHQWKLGRRIHAVHHKIRTPYAKDSLYIHPVETLLGVGLLMACTLIVGPISVYSFGASFFVYSVLNILIHSAFDIPIFPFRWLSALSRNHDTHHHSMKGGYYASISPLWDLVFGTAR
ncbi:MAG: sterol desaturase/sphingolipid hydroxylase (fatty acid hydroxylase superfamily) [Bradymonadia bacterium]|jgi:sterol desaturase/sphingolipid hydroxylase (fatty acid hydroxylase superfamily)